MCSVSSFKGKPRSLQQRKYATISNHVDSVSKWQKSSCGLLPLRWRCGSEKFLRPSFQHADYDHCLLHEPPEMSRRPIHAAVILAWRIFACNPWRCNIIFHGHKGSYYRSDVSRHSLRFAKQELAKATQEMAGSSGTPRVPLCKPLKLDYHNGLVSRTWVERATI